MSSKTIASGCTSLEFNAGDWLELEVPGELIDSNWTDDDIRRKARERCGSQSISKDALRIVWLQVKDESSRDQLRKKKTDSFDLIDALESDVLKCIFAAYCFTRRTDDAFTDYYFQRLNRDIDDKYEELYNRISGKSRRIAKTLFLYMYNRESLKSIFSLNHIVARKPKEIGQCSTTLSNPVDDMNIETILKVLKSDSRDARHWHDFEHDGKRYLTIKRHYLDAVDTQTDQNEEIERAEYVITKFEGSRVDIYTERKPTASSVRKSLGGAYEKSNVNFDRAEDRKPRSHFADVDPARIISEIDDLSNHTVIGVRTHDSKLSNNPQVLLRTEDERVLPSIREIQNASSRFFTNMQQVSQIIIKKNQTTYTILPRQDPRDDNQWYVRYQASGISDNDRSEFESDMEDVLNIVPCFIASD